MKKLISVVFVLLLALTCVFVACDNNTIADNTEYYDKITKTLKFNLNYEGKSFFKDGVGEVRVDSFTDGDTTRFYSATDGSFSVRYYSIDTPESTGGVEKWGKAASNFVKERLSEATVIVLESSTGGAAVKDSYGTRYLGYVWYKTATDDFKLLNLEIVENGFSTNKGNSTSSFKYNSYFVQAEQFARSIKLRLFSKLADPLFSSDPVDFSIKEFEDNNDLFYNEETDSGAKVVFEAYLIALNISDGGWYTFVAAQYDEETGEQYTINVYTGGSATSASMGMKIGEMYRIVGSVQKYTSGFQISGINFSDIYESPTLTYVTKSHCYLTFDQNVTYTDRYAGNMYTYAKITEVGDYVDGVLTVQATAYNRTASGNAQEATTFTLKFKVSEETTSNFTVDRSIRLTGVQLTAGEIIVLTYTLI